MTLNEAINEAEGYISKLNEIIKWFKDTTKDELEQSGEAVLEEYNGIIEEWELTECWTIFDEHEKDGELWNKYQALYRGFNDKIAELNKEIDKACEPLTRWDILDMKADELYDEMRAEEARNK